MGELLSLCLSVCSCECVVCVRVSVWCVCVLVLVLIWLVGAHELDSIEECVKGKGVACPWGHILSRARTVGQQGTVARGQVRQSRGD